ncbi:Response regulator receiver protein (modular protein) [Candidatus Contendobacter odensis Run_B_J11]|uniref:Response regulator receiver protein (Modular protein) n=2 Tax=Candidatus Contendibacter odensensis TaxID=1400860 RepID=A0A7U7J5N2_9GAMM|nr:Response regulator receiver protein (modular protein) [Candidatus Contendobacter odensis Run_B_J11]
MKPNGRPIRQTSLIRPECATVLKNQHNTRLNENAWQPEGTDMANKILVVDDEPNIVLSLEFLMKQAGFQVRTASDGEAALAAIAAEPPDLVLLDVMMPRKNGYEVCQAIRANPAWKGTRIIMLTAKGREVEREKGLALGADDYITKPFSTQEVVERVRELLAEAD